MTENSKASSRCQKCGVDLHPGLCGICARQEMQTELNKLQEMIDAIRNSTKHYVWDDPAGPLLSRIDQIIKKL